KVDLSKRPQIVALNKIDGLDEDIIKDRLAELKPAVKRGTSLLAISAVSGQGIQELLYKVKALASKRSASRQKADKSIPVMRLSDVSENWKVTKHGDMFEVSGS